MVSTHRRSPYVQIGGRIHRKKMCGTGMGSVLMNVGGAGSGSSYPSPQEYQAITGRPIGGSGLGDHSLNKKLEALKIKPLFKKPVNIKFEP